MEGSISKRKVTLTDDVLYILSKDYLSDQDCLSLALSRALSKRYASLHGNKRKCNISRCFFLRVSQWETYFQRHICPARITTFNAQHSYWIPAKLLVHHISQMKNLEDLNVLGTKITLHHLQDVFPSCEKITRLGFSLAGLVTLLDFQEDTSKNKDSLKYMIDGFRRLTHVSIFNFERNRVDPNDCIFELPTRTGVKRYELSGPDRCITSWAVTLGVLSWCRDCIHLKIHVPCASLNSIDYIKYEDDLEDQVNRHLERRLEKYCKKVLFPSYLHWMRSLQSLAIYRGSDHHSSQDTYIEMVLKWILEGENCSLQRLWVDDLYDHIAGVPYRENLSAPSVTTFCVGYGSISRYIDVTNPRFHQIQQLTGVDFTRLAELPHLKYAISGRLEDPHGTIGFDEFCEAHPLLEYLDFSTGRMEMSSTPLNNFGSWSLPKLKNLVYGCIYPVKGIIDHLIKSCPHVESFKLSCCQDKPSERLISPSTDCFDFLSAIKFRNLKSLTLNGFYLGLLDGSFLKSILEQCPKLERLHLSGKFISGVFLSNLGEHLPLATHLRDFRLEWGNNETLSSLLLLLKSLLKCSDHLERLVLIKSSRYCVDWETPSEMENLIVGFATEMERLVALCLVGFRISSDVVRNIEQRVEKEIVPLRPPFWCHFGLPASNDPNVPVVHMTEIVDPFGIPSDLF